MGMLSCLDGKLPPAQVWSKKKNASLTVLVLEPKLDVTNLLMAGGFKGFFMFIPKIGEMIQFDDHIFSDGLVFKHQLVCHFWGGILLTLTFLILLPVETQPTPLDRPIFDDFRFCTLNLGLKKDQATCLTRPVDTLGISAKII